MTIAQVFYQGFVLFPQDLTKEPLEFCKVDRCTNEVESDKRYCDECADIIARETYWDMKFMERRGE